jgi:RNA polymerase sigma-54 factor
LHNFIIDRLVIKSDNFDNIIEGARGFVQLVQKQQFKLSPRLYQSINMLRLPLIELREKIAQELEQNPALELVEDPSTVSLDSDSPQDNDDYDFESASDAPFIKGGSDAAADEHQKFIESVLSRPESLQEHLLWQLRLQPIAPDIRRIGEQLIQNLDEDGFHVVPVASLFKNEAPERIEAAMTLVQSLDPVGTCVADYRESLQVQVALYDDEFPYIGKALSYLELFERGKFAEVAKKLYMSEEDAEECFECIKELSPFPGRQFSGTSPRYVIPDAQVVKRDGVLSIIINNEEIPVLGISPFFVKLAKDKRKDKTAREYARENIKLAREFIGFIKGRNQTLRKVSHAIVRFQSAFFEHGPKNLAPLTLNDVAEVVKLDESTVSRAVKDKYLQTEWGVFELRYFFTNPICGISSDGAKFSKIGVKEILRELIGVEQRHFSDKELVGLLAARGIRIARRTVAKYRSELDLGSSYVR